MKARFLGTLRGKRVYRFPVRITQSWLDRDLHHDEVTVEVTAHTAADAGRLVRDEIAHKVERPTELLVAGPRGGRAWAGFVGWESMIVAEFCRVRGPQQLRFL